MTHVHLDSNGNSNIVDTIIIPIMLVIDIVECTNEILLVQLLLQAQEHQNIHNTSYRSKSIA